MEEPHNDTRHIRSILTHDEVVQKLTDHLSAYELHRVEYLERQRHQDEAYEKNLHAIEALTKATTGVVEAWAVANGVQRFIVWLSKFALLAGIASYISNRFGIKII